MMFYYKSSSVLDVALVPKESMMKFWRFCRSQTSKFDCLPLHLDFVQNLRTQTLHKVCHSWRMELDVQVLERNLY